MGDHMRDEIDEVWRKLVQSRVGAHRLKRGLAELAHLVVGVVVQHSRTDLVKVEDELLRDDVLNMGPEGDVIVSGKCSESWVGARALGDELLRAGLGGRGVLGDVGLDAFDGEPVSCRGKPESVYCQSC